MLMRILCEGLRNLLGCRCAPEAQTEPKEERAERAAPAARRADDNDDLKAIKGIGIVMENRLMAAGFTSYEDLAGATPEEVRSALAGYGRGAGIEEWIEQARDLARK